MKKSKKISIIIAVAMLIIGCLIAFFALISFNFDFSKLNTVNSVTKTYDVDESFKNINIEGVECDIHLIPSDNDKCSVICNEGDKISPSVTVQNDTLTIKRIDNRQWYEHIMVFYWGEVEINLYLPQNKYEELYIKSVSGDVEIPENFTFDKAEISTTSGEINFLSKVNNDIDIKTVSGDIYVGETTAKNINIQSTSGDTAVSSATIKNELNVKSVSGNINLSNIECQSINANTTSGDNKFSNVVAKTNTKIESISGNVDLYQSDAVTMNIKTTSGDVTGTLLTDKIFDVKTTSGDVNVPPSGTGGKCEIKTTSGNIELKITEQHKSSSLPDKKTD